MTSRQNRGAASFGGFIFLQQHRAGALAHHQAVAADVKGPGRQWGVSLKSVEQASRLSKTATVVVSYSSAPPQSMASCMPNLTVS